MEPVSLFLRTCPMTTMESQVLRYEEKKKHIARVGLKIAGSVSNRQ